MGYGCAFHNGHYARGLYPPPARYERHSPPRLREGEGRGRRQAGARVSVDDDPSPNGSALPLPKWPPPLHMHNTQRASCVTCSAQHVSPRHTCSALHAAHCRRVVMAVSDVRVGGLVRLASGGPVMTVYDVHVAVCCAWFDRQRVLHREAFSPGMLGHVSGEVVAPPRRGPVHDAVLMAWLPMDIAPIKVAEHVILTDGARVFTGWFSYAEGRWLESERSDGDRETEPMYWMPFPRPPRSSDV